MANPREDTWGFNTADKDSLLNLINLGGGEDFDPNLFNFDQSIIVRTPAGGIPAATATDTQLAMGSAECTRVGSEGAVITGDTLTIYNMVNLAIGGDLYAKANRVGDRYIVDVAQCPASS